MKHICLCVRTILKTTVICSAFTLCLVAQQPQGSSGPLTDQRVVELVRAGVSADELARIIATASQVSFDLSPSGTDGMMNAGVSEDTIKAMAAREQGTTPVTDIHSTRDSIQQPLPEPKEHTERTVGTDVFVGYSYLNADMNGYAPRQSLNGWQAAVTIRPIRWFGIEGDFAGYYKSYGISTTFTGASASASASLHNYTFMGGPRANFGIGFVHALFGGDLLGGSGTGTATYYGEQYSLSGSDSVTSFAMAFGGGIQSKPFAKHWAIRTSADYLMTRFGSVNQNNVRVSGGIVYIFGGREGSRW